jgi:phosphoglycerate kinase
MFKQNNLVKEKYYLDHLEMENKRVVCRLDLNVPKVGEVVTDDFRISSAIPTIQSILSKNPKYLVITSHFGRPKEREEKYSTKFMVPILEKYIGLPVQFLEDGIHENTLHTLEHGSGVYLLENVRFHKEETGYEKDDLRENDVVKMYSQMGDVFICDAFGCLHRKHMSIYGPKDFGKPRGYGDLIKKEIKAIDILTSNQYNGKRILGIVGGNKIADKMPIIDSLRKINNSFVYVAGGLAKQWDNSIQYPNVVIMSDGYGNVDLLQDPIYVKNINETNCNIYDVGNNSLDYLKYLIKKSDILFWNGSLGVIEHEHYKKGSLELVQFLEEECKDKTIIIGGGETASLFSKDENNIKSHIYVSTGGGALLEYLQNKILYGKNLVGLEIYI